MAQPKTLSDDYRQQLAEKHASDENWGNTSLNYYDLLMQMVHHYDLKSILDYGCGKGMTGKRFRQEQAMPGCTFKHVEFFEYDPAIPEKMHDTSKAELLYCTDVMEHIEPDFLDSTLKDMEERTLRAAFLVISTVPAMHILPDGRNAHLIVEKPEWWLKKLREYFDISKHVVQDVGMLVICVKRQPQKTA